MSPFLKLSIIFNTITTKNIVTWLSEKLTMLMLNMALHFKFIYDP